MDQNTLILAALGLVAAGAIFWQLHLLVRHQKRVADVLEISHEADIIGVKAARAAKVGAKEKDAALAGPIAGWSESEPLMPTRGFERAKG